MYKLVNKILNETKFVEEQENILKNFFVNKCIKEEKPV